MDDVQSTAIPRNALLSFASQAIPLLAAVAAVPYLLASLGAERFALLALVWFITSAAPVADLGVSRATTAFVARMSDRSEASTLVWTSLAINVGIGVVLGSLVFAGGFAIRGPLREAEDAVAVAIVSLTVPLAMTANVLRGLLEGRQRFGRVALVVVPANALMYLLPAFGAALFGFRGALAGIALSRVASLAGLASFAHGAGLHSPFTPSVAQARRLLLFGGWLTASALVGVAIVFADRLIVVSVISLAALAPYSVAYEVVNRLWVIPHSVASASLPAMSVANASKVRRLYLQGIRYVTMVVGIAAVIVAAASYVGLQLWLGPQIAEDAWSPLRVLALGVAISSVGYLPTVALVSQGRPDLPARIHLCLLLPSLAVSYLLAIQYGLTGIAVAWVVRSSVDLVALLIAARRTLPALAGVLSSRRLAESAAALALAWISTAWYAHDSTILGALQAVGVLSFLLVFLYQRSLTGGERAVVRQLPARLFALALSWRPPQRRSSR